MTLTRHLKTRVEHICNHGSIYQVRLHLNKNAVGTVSLPPREQKNIDTLGTCLDTTPALNPQNPEPFFTHNAAINKVQRSQWGDDGLGLCLDPNPNSNPEPYLLVLIVVTLTLTRSVQGNKGMQNKYVRLYTELKRLDLQLVTNESDPDRLVLEVRGVAARCDKGR